MINEFSKDLTLSFCQKINMDKTNFINVMSYLYDFLPDMERHPTSNTSSIASR